MLKQGFESEARIMTKKVPMYVLRKVDRMNNLMQKIVDLNLEVEEWLEKNGVTDGYDFANQFRDDRGYGIYDVLGFENAVERVINGR